MEIIEFIKRGIARAVKGGWWSFVIGYLVVVAGLAAIALILVHWVPPLEVVFRKASALSAFLPWGCVVTGSGALAGMVLAFGLKAHLMTMEERLKTMEASLVKNPATKPLWDAKLRILDRLQHEITCYGDRLRMLKSTDTSPDPLEDLVENVRLAFITLSKEVWISKDIVCGGVQNNPVDHECLTVLRKMEDLQEHGTKILMRWNGGAGDLTVVAAQDFLNGTLVAIQNVANECRKIMEKRGMC